MHGWSFSTTVLRLSVVGISALVLAGCGGADDRGRGDGAVVAEAPPAAAATVVAARTRPSGPLVDVAGRVRRPGVYELPRGARVHEAITAAGGVRPGADLASLNRAAPVVDGQQIVVADAPGPTGVAGAAGPAAGASPPAKISINSADVTQLDGLPGVGPVTAEHIVAERTSGGPFASVDDLERVPGIGPATIDSLRDRVTV